MSNEQLAELKTGWKSEKEPRCDVLYAGVEMTVLVATVLGIGAMLVSSLMGVASGTGDVDLDIVSVGGDAEPVNAVSIHREIQLLRG